MPTRIEAASTSAVLPRNQPDFSESNAVLRDQSRFSIMFTRSSSTGARIVTPSAPLVAPATTCRKELGTSVILRPRRDVQHSPLQRRSLTEHDEEAAERASHGEASNKSARASGFCNNKAGMMSG